MVELQSIPYFPELRDRGLRLPAALIYGAIVAFRAVGHEPCKADLARACGLDARRCRSHVRRQIEILMRAGLVTAERRGRSGRSDLYRHVPLRTEASPLGCVA